jgi:methionyl-tRNA formyltransferase
MSKIKVAILFDPTNDWIKGYVTSSPLIDELSGRYDISFFDDHKKARDFEVVFILGYTKLLDRNFLDSNRLNLVVHESALPEGKGFSPVQWQVLDNNDNIPVSLIEAVEEADAGEIIENDTIDLTGYELFDEIREKQAAATMRIIGSFFSKYPDYKKTSQSGKGSFYRKRTEKDDELDPEKSIREQFNHLRIANNEDFPLYFIVDGHKYYIKISK